MDKTDRVMSIVTAVLLALAATAGPGLCAANAEEARESVKRAKAAAGAIPAQADALTRLAWPENGRPDPQVAALARAELIDFSSHGLAALRATLSRVDRVYTADVLATLLQARRRLTESNPAEYIPALEDALWVGSSDARRIALPELAMHRYGPALMACVDTAIQFPGLRETVIRTLGDFRDHRARFYLGEVLLEGPEELRPLAAASLAQIGGPAMAPLHGASLLDDPGIRLPAIRALTPAAGIDDLTTLYEYIGRFPDDDETLLQEIAARCEFLEAALEQRMDFDSASPSPLE